MGLIDDVRKKRDSWIGRLEEQRQEDYQATDKTFDNSDSELSEEDIKRNLERVGKFDKKN